VAASILLERGASNLLILEQGSALTRRGCPGLRCNSCTYCNGNLCHVSGGEGGSSARFGNKLCYFPASNGILNYFAKDIVDSSYEYLDEILGPYFDSRFNHPSASPDTENDHSSHRSESTRKQYVSKILLRSEFQQLTERLVSRPRQAGLLRLNSSVTQILREGQSGFLVFTEDGERISARHLVLGSGRSSYAFLQQVLPSLNAEWHPACPDIGIRLEVPSAYFTEECTYQPDPKYKFVHPPNGSSRTFCGCHGGIIVPVKFGQSYYADGAFGDKLSASSNLAFMTRSDEPISNHLLERWCGGINAAAGDTLLLGHVSLSLKSTQQLVQAIMALVPNWPTDAHRAMMSDLLRLTLGDKVNLLRRSECSSASVKVYAPAIDLYWPRLRLSTGLETAVPGLFALGDITGVSRGFVQAMVSGAAWAVARLNASHRLNTVHSLQKEHTEWFASV